MLATLSSLRIKNLALVEELDWTLAPGFVAVTGETGAGKSVILGALKLLLGERAEKTLIRTGADSCTVEACFEVHDCGALDSELEEHGLEGCVEGHLIVKRTFTQAGGNRQFVNGSPTTLAVLKQLGDLLVDLHGPHDHQSLLSAERQLDLLDAFSRSESTRQQYVGVWSRLAKLREEHASLASNEAALDRELELLRHQATEIQAADLQPDEEDALQSRYTLAANSRRLIELATGVAHELSESEPSVLQRLSETARLLRELEKTDPAAALMAEAHTSAVVELEELARSLVAYADKLDLDPAQLAEMEERVTLLQTLKRKYGATVEAVIAFGEESAARLQKIEHRGAELTRLQDEIDAAQAELMRVGRELSKLRLKGAPRLSGGVREQLRDLGFKKSEFDIHLLQLDAPGANGLETIEFVFAPRSTGLESVEFLFAPNPGEPPKPLRSIGSSGEISRVMLAVKSALADQDAVPLLVFDEIDANVGGEIAHAVAGKMKTLGQRHQVLVITHLPQVAAAAAAHYVVTKEFTDERTYSRLGEVKTKARVREIARMLGGQSDSAVALARPPYNVMIPVSPPAWRRFTADILQWQRAELNLVSSLPCLAAVAIPLALGAYAHQPRLGMVAASGAMSVGFGAFHRLGRSNLGPMLLASVGMCLSTLVGSLASHSFAASVAVAGLWGFGYGMLGVFGAAVSWTVLQWVVFLVIVGAYPVDAHQAVTRAALTLAGGLSQTLLVTGITFLAARLRVRRGAPLPPGVDRDLATPLQPWQPAARDFQFAWRAALTLAATTAAYRWLALPNGYWVPMTVAIVLRPDFQQTASRGLGRLLGTLLGAGLATLLAAELRPEPATTAVLIVLFTWLCYALIRVNYTLYAACITSYVVFLFAFIGLPEREVVAHRMANTAIGGACAMVSYLHYRRRSKLAGEPVLG